MADQEEVSGRARSWRLLVILVVILGLLGCSTPEGSAPDDRSPGDRGDLNQGAGEEAPPMTNLNDHPLFTLMPPPVQPNHDGYESWEETEAFLGFQLPAQLKAFIDTYGSGGIADELGITGYREENSRIYVIDVGTTHWPDDPLPLPMYPSDGPALFPIGWNGNGDYIYGVVSDGVMGDETFWIGNVKYKRRLKEDGPFLDFLHRILSGAAPPEYYDESRGWAHGLEPVFR